jgi:hypothetical protein
MCGWLIFLVLDTDDKAVCTIYAIIIILATGLTALFHYAIDHGYGLHWLSLRVVLKQRMDPTGSKGKERPNRKCRREAEQLSTAKPKIFQADPSQDEALNSSRPIL